MYEKIVKRYMQAWLEKDLEVVKQTFAEHAVYVECYGPEYHGRSQIVQWFKDWNKKGQVLEWTVKRTMEHENVVVVEWYFKCNYDGVMDGFDGVTIAEFDHDEKISRLCEYQSKAEHYYPYEQ